MSKPEDKKKSEKSGSKRKPFAFVLAALCVLIAVAAVVAAVRLAPKRPVATTVPTEATETQTAPTEAVPTEPATTDGETEISVPAPTEPAPAKPYAIFVDPVLFTSLEENGITTVTGLNDPSAVLTVEPLAVSFDEECAALRATLTEGTKLDIPYANAGFGNGGDAPTDVTYVIDDGNGGCLLARYHVPDGGDQYRDEFEIALGMIRVGE